VGCLLNNFNIFVEKRDCKVHGAPMMNSLQCSANEQLPYPFTACLTSPTIFSPVFHDNQSTTLWGHPRAMVWCQEWEMSNATTYKEREDG